MMTMNEVGIMISLAVIGFSIGVKTGDPSNGVVFVGVTFFLFFFLRLVILTRNN